MMAGRACGFMHLLVLVAGYCWYIEGARDFRPLPMIAAGAAFLAMCMALSMEAWALAGARVGAKYGNFVTSEVRLPVLLVGFGVSPPVPAKGVLQQGDLRRGSRRVRGVPHNGVSAGPGGAL